MALDCTAIFDPIPAPRSYVAAGIAREHKELLWLSRGATTLPDGTCKRILGREVRNLETGDVELRGCNCDGVVVTCKPTRDFFADPEADPPREHTGNVVMQGLGALVTCEGFIIPPGITVSLGGFPGWHLVGSPVRHFRHDACFTTPAPSTFIRFFMHTDTASMFIGIHLVVAGPNQYGGQLFITGVIFGPPPTQATTIFADRGQPCGKLHGGAVTCFHGTDVRPALDGLEFTIGGGEPGRIDNWDGPASDGAPHWRFLED